MSFCFLLFLLLGLGLGLGLVIGLGLGFRVSGNSGLGQKYMFPVVDLETTQKSFSRSRVGKSSSFFSRSLTLLLLLVGCSVFTLQKMHLSLSV